MLSAPRSPWQRAYVERVVGSIRRECLEHVIVYSEASLYRQMKSFVKYHHETRAHLSLRKDSPMSRPVQPSGLWTSDSYTFGIPCSLATSCAASGEREVIASTVKSATAISDHLHVPDSEARPNDPDLVVPSGSWLREIWVSRLERTA
jgi:hypothetical protein